MWSDFVLCSFWVHCNSIYREFTTIKFVYDCITLFFFLSLRCFRCFCLFLFYFFPYPRSMVAASVECTANDIFCVCYACLFSLNNAYDWISARQIIKHIFQSHIKNVSLRLIASVAHTLSVLLDFVSNFCYLFFAWKSMLQCT